MQAGADAPACVLLIYGKDRELEGRRSFDAAFGLAQDDTGRQWHEASHTRQVQALPRRSAEK